MEHSLAKQNISFSRLDGRLSLKERVKVIQQFGTADKSKHGASALRAGSVLLISMKAGGVGLNLVAASSCFIADPWWNGAVEDQCINRIHRIGQTADKVRVRKFYVADSVEERIIELQKRKKKVATKILRDGKPGLEDSSSARPTLEDFKVLFQSGRFG
jgi:DNA repair protein RAD5